jgi:4-hydroxy-tetrahydrodipicolinate reductase
MEKIKVIVNGLPGKMAWAVATAVINSRDMKLIPMSLTGPEVVNKHVIVDGTEVQLFGPDEMSRLLTGEFPDVVIDFTLPSAIEQNVDFYAKMKLPFVLGTTGGNMDYIARKVDESGLNAVVAPNMAKPIVAFQAMMEFAASNFPGAFEGFNLRIKESHQKTKVDTSGTAKAMVLYFNKLGIPFSVDQIEKKRTEEDYKAMGIPAEHWAGHGWHAYSLDKEFDDSVFLKFTHNINGRQVYADGALSATRFLFGVEVRSLSHGHVYSMIDVLIAG